MSRKKRKHAQQRKTEGIEEEFDESFTVDEFLRIFVDGYLIADIDTMLQPEAKPAPDKPGHLGYPLFMALAAGIELLGSLRFSNHSDLGADLLQPRKVGRFSAVGRSRSFRIDRLRVACAA